MNTGNTIFLAGWSACLGRMAAKAFVQDAGGGEFRRSASVYGKHLMPSGPFGGRLVIAELARDGISIRVRPMAPAATA